MQETQPETEPEPEEETVYSLNPEVQIDPEAWQQALNQLLERLQSENRVNLASAIREGRNGLRHNEWTLAVANDVLFQIVDREKDLLPELRQAIAVPDLYLVLQVDPSLAGERSEQPYTEEQKLQAMAEDNPALIKLQKIFKTRIIY